MSRHEGVSCDCCLKTNFRGRRYKCLRCFDFDLCSTCFESGAVNTRHSADHPMQCILTRQDYELFYGGEILPFSEEPQSITCPYCGQNGFTEVTLQEHVTSKHADASFDVICPICAATPGGEPNCATDDFAGHLALEHRSIPLLDEPVASSQNVRRAPHPGGFLNGGRGASTNRGTRRNMQFRYFADYINGPFGISLTDTATIPSDRLSRVFSPSNASAVSPSSSRENDPISSLLSQLSGVRRITGATSAATAPTQLQQLQSQLQFERAQFSSISRSGRRHNAVRDTGCSTAFPMSMLFLNTTAASAPQQPASIASPTATTTSDPPPPSPSNFLLSNAIAELSISTPDEELQQDRREFMQELVLSSLERSTGVPVGVDGLIRALEQLERKMRERPRNERRIVELDDDDLFAE